MKVLVVYFDKVTGQRVASEYLSKVYVDGCPYYLEGNCSHWGWKAQVLNEDGSVYKLVAY